jgi:hypothetical protein
MESEGLKGVDELSYEEEQLQLILFNEMKEKKIVEERRFKEEQTNEYLESLKIDEERNSRKVDEALVGVELECYEVTVEEMRRVRLLRFEKKNSS